MTALPNRLPRRAAARVAGAALRAARTARRLARLLRLHRLHRARRDGDRRRRLVRAQPHRRAGARRPHDPRRRPLVLADPARGQARRTSPSCDRAARSRSPPRMRGDGAHRRRPLGAGRAQGGRRRLSAARRADARSRTCRWPMRWPSATARSAPPSIRRCWRGSISSSATASPSAARPFEIRAWSSAEPDKLAGGIGFGPRFLVSEAGLRATGLLQPGSLVRWIYRLRLPDNAADDRAATALVDDARKRAAGGRLGDPQPQQCLAAARAQHRALHPVPDAGRPDRAAGRRRRRRQRGEEPSRPQARRHRHVEGARRDRRPRVRDLSDAGDRAAGDRRGDRARRRRGAAVRHRRRCSAPSDAAADRAGAACRRARAGVRLRPADRARLRAVAARPRARRAGRGAVPRRGRAASGAGRAGAISR